MASFDGISSKRDRKEEENSRVSHKINKRSADSVEPIFSDFISSPALLQKHDQFVRNMHSRYQTLKKNFKNLISSLHFKNVAIRVKYFKFPKPNLTISRLNIKSLIIISVCGILFAFSFFWVLSTKNEVIKLEKESSISIEKTMGFLEEGNLELALKEANIAESNLKKMKLMVQSLGQDVVILKSLPFNQSKLTTDEGLLDASFSILNTLNSVNDKFSGLIPQEQLEVDLTNKSNVVMLNIASSQQSIIGAINTSKNSLEKTRTSLEKSQRSASDKDKEMIEKALSLIASTFDKMNFVEQLASDDLSWISGSGGSKRKLLILFQNNDELRGGSAGSLGSFGVAEFENGNLKNIDFGKNIFKIDQAFEATGQYIEPPAELKFLRGDKSWTLKDSGWAVDGSDALKNIMDFYQKEVGESVDGVMMIDTTAVASLIAATKPIDMPEYQTTITSENLRSTLEYQTHVAYWDQAGSQQENEPKKIISDMMPKFLNQLLNGFGNKDLFPKIASSFSMSLRQKDILFYFQKNDLQERIRKINYDGKIIEALGDYVYLNNSNVNGAKSSLNIDETINMTANIQKDGKILNQLEIHRNHIGNGVAPDGTNTNFCRLLLPSGSQINSFNPILGNFQQFLDKGLKDGSPFWKTTEANKDVINFWMNTKPGEESTATISYQSGYSVKTNNDFVYVLSLQKQPGASSDKFNLKVNFPEEFIPTNVSNYDIAGHSLTLKMVLNKDQTIKIKFSGV